VNKSLNKTPFTEAQILNGYARLGSINRSPIWTPDDFAEADWKARVQGIGIGIGVTTVAVGIIWAVQS
jgi:hypothetical protein